MFSYHQGLIHFQYCFSKLVLTSRRQVGISLVLPFLMRQRPYAPHRWTLELHVAQRQLGVDERPLEVERSADRVGGRVCTWKVAI